MAVYRGGGPGNLRVGGGVRELLAVQPHGLVRRGVALRRLRRAEGGDGERLYVDHAAGSRLRRPRARGQLDERPAALRVLHSSRYVTSRSISRSIKKDKKAAPFRKLPFPWGDRVSI